MSNIRDAELSQMLSGILGRLSPPRGLAGNDTAQSEEIKSLLRALSRCAPSQGYRDWFERFSDALASRMKTRAWPIVSEIEAAAASLALTGRSSGTGADGADYFEGKAIDRMEEWFRKFGDQMPAHGKPMRTAALINRGVLRDLELARFIGFDLTLEQSEQARAMPMGPESQANYDRVMGDLRDIQDRQFVHAVEVAANRATVKGSAKPFPATGEATA